MNYIQMLTDKLPELKSIDGYPNATVEDILSLSTPPNYTACPNPFIKDFIAESAKKYNEEDDRYHCEPFVGDVSEGKNDPIYVAHSYHTKVPHKAIMEYIAHYTQEGDVVFDGFSGSGMTGVAANQLNRNSILSDLSPLASFISYNFNVNVDPVEFINNSKRILQKVKEECGWMYETLHTDGRTKGEISHTVWSDVLVCPYCSQEHIFWDEAIEKNNYEISDKYKCPNCRAELDKTEIKDVYSIVFDEALNRTIEQVKKVPVLIVYTIGSRKFQKKPDEHDLSVIAKIENEKIPYWYPSYKIMDKDDRWGDLWVPAHHLGITHSHHFYLKRNLWILSCFFNNIEDSYLKFQFTSIALLASKLQRWRPDGKSGILTGTLYIASLIREENIFKLWANKIKALSKIKASPYKFGRTIVSTQSATSFPNIPENSIDYIFTDPPFGRNIMYSEASFVWESWLKVINNNSTEAVINKTQNKKLEEYASLMHNAFQEFYRILKPKRWMTVEFHNAKSSVWNAIQEAISKAGFIIVQVTVLDKKSGSYKQVTAPGSVEKDLVISAFKPTKKFEERFLKQSGQNLEVELIDQVLSMQSSTPSVNRTDKMLYSKMVAYYIQKGYEIKYDAKSFYRLLKNNFVEEDGFWFTANQINSYLEYKKKMRLEGMDEFKSASMFLFVSDEKSAILWLYNFLNAPKSFSDISIAFTQLANIQGDSVPELQDLLEQNFIIEGDKYRRPKTDPEHDYLTEKRDRALVREFETLLIKAKTEKGKIKSVRKEALAFGFELCYKAKRYEDILTVAKKLDKAILENSAEVNDFVEAAEIMVQGVA